MPIDIEFVVNEKPVTVTVEPRWTLADVLREQLGLTGTHLGCEYGVCGACTVLVDAEPVRACLLFAVQMRGRHVTTVESLGAEGRLHPLQEAFWEEHGLQCGFCTPGFLMTSLHLLRTNPHPSRQQIREALEGNLCRCTGYQFIVNAVERAAKQMTGSEAANEAP
ncbi:MAG TPA: (2Fe-2S)-binding protein [Ktedonobacterales bacterium]|jgi:carbon-monoxide dehydrogenase small subunit|nr:(2Fe-2S)-binding protein [Ktedonobacterales bacterium]